MQFFFEIIVLVDKINYYNLSQKEKIIKCIKGMDENDYYDYYDCIKSTFEITLGSGFVRKM